MPEELVSDVSDASTDVSSEAPSSATDEESTPVQSADDKWNAIDFSAKEENEVEPVPAESAVEEEGAAAEVVDESTETVEEDELPELSAVESSDGVPLPLSRKIFREVEAKTLTRLRNPDAPVADVIQGFSEFHPQRWAEVEKTIGVEFVHKSAEDFPNEWLQAITGIEGLTVDQVKELVARPDVQTSAEVEPIDEIETYLTEFYGEDWKDPQKDHLLSADDVNAAKLARQLRILQDNNTANDSKQQTKIDALQKSLDEIMPQIEAVQTEQKLELERLEHQYYTTGVNDYRRAIEQRIMPKVFTEAGLDANENDSDAVKAVKDEIKSAFTSKYDENGGAEFDLYLSYQFPKREMLGKVVQRVDALLANEGKLKAQADKKASSPDDAARLRKEAASIRQQADTEQATLAVLHLEAARDFVKSKSALMAVLDENAQLQRQLGMNGRRVEIVGSASANGQTFVESLKDKTTDEKWNAENIFGTVNQGAAR